MNLQGIKNEQSALKAPLRNYRSPFPFRGLMENFGIMVGISMFVFFWGQFPGEFFAWFLGYAVLASLVFSAAESGKFLIDENHLTVSNWILPFIRWRYELNTIDRMEFRQIIGRKHLIIYRKTNRRKSIMCATLNKRKSLSLLFQIFIDHSIKVDALGGRYGSR